MSRGRPLAVQVLLHALAGERGCISGTAKINHDNGFMQRPGKGSCVYHPRVSTLDTVRPGGIQPNQRAAARPKKPGSPKLQRKPSYSARRE